MACSVFKDTEVHDTDVVGLRPVSTWIWRLDISFVRNVGLGFLTSIELRDPNSSISPYTLARFSVCPLWIVLWWFLLGGEGDPQGAERWPLQISSIPDSGSTRTTPTAS